MLIKFYRFLAEALDCLLNEVKYQSHVRVRVRFRSGSVLVLGFVSGFASGSYLGSCLVI